MNAPVIILKNPAQTYLNTLQSLSSRKSMSSFIQNGIALIHPGETMDSYDWYNLDRHFVIDLRNALSEQNKSPNTINGYLSAFRGVAKQAWKEKWIDVETYQLIKDEKMQKGSRVDKGRSLTIDELNILIDFCMTNENPIYLRDAVAISLMYGAGLRRHEIAKCKVSDLDIEEQEITVTGKGNKQRTNPLPSRVVEIIQCWIEERKELINADIISPFLLLRFRKGGRPVNEGITDKAIYDIVVKLYKEAGLSRLSPHDLRRTYATQLLENGIDIFTVQDLMDHADISTTKGYDKRQYKVKKSAVKSLNF